MDPTWVVLADEGRARILAMRGEGADLAEVEEMTDAAAHADDADLRRDAYGRRSGPDLRIAAAPRFLGRLRKVLDPQVAKAVVDEIDKDLLQLSRRALTQRLYPPRGGGTAA